MGVLRITLALIVMITHLVHFSPSGTYAVFGFYIISGYLMTLIMHESYGYTFEGRSRYLINRILRLYPQYWCSLLFTILLIDFIGFSGVLRFNSIIFIPYSYETWASNISMVFLKSSPTYVPRLIPQAWTLTIEMFFYLLICIGISKTFNRTQLWFAASVIYTIAALSLELNRYNGLMASSLPFSIGALIYYLPKSKLPAIPLFILMVVNCYLWTLYPKAIFGFYINILICAFLVSSLTRGTFVSESLDKRLGDLSYPVYLLHFSVGMLVSELVFGQPLHEHSFRGFINLVISLFFIYGLSSLFIKYVDQPIQTIRTRIKHANKRRIDRSPTETTDIRCVV